MRKYILLLLIIFSSLSVASAQQLYPDSTGNPDEQFSMVIPQDTTHLALIAGDSIYPYPIIIDTEEGWRNIGWWIPYPLATSLTLCSPVWVTLTINVVAEVAPPKTESALGLIAASASRPVKNPAVHHSARAAEHFEALVTLPD